MIKVLEEALIKLPALLKDPSVWDSLVINRRKPFTYRAFYQDGDTRICLHRFEPCDSEEAFMHPHAWPMACKLLKGTYRMKYGISKYQDSTPDHFEELTLTSGSSYSMTNPFAWHSVEPVGLCFTVMVNGAPWVEEVRHKHTRTTKGKDLEKMTPEALNEHLITFAKLLSSDMMHITV